MMKYEPRVLKCKDLGIVIEYKVGRVWADVVAFKSTKVYLKKVRIAQLDFCATAYEYPGGLAQAVQRFLHPIGGDHRVAPEAKSVLENIMHTYAINTTSGKVVGRFPNPEAAAVLVGNTDLTIVSSQADVEEKLTLKDMATVVSEATGKPASKPKNKQAGAKKVVAALESVKLEAPKATSREDKVYKIKPDADFSKRRGGFRLTLDAIAGLNSEDKPATAHAVHAEVCKHKPGYKFGDIYSDISMARRYGYLSE